jgi:hypothetical protein
MLSKSLSGYFFLIFYCFYFYSKDFYLISQHVNQGTVNPTHYHVIEGHEHLNPERMQTLTYKFTHLYYNWPVSS